MAVEVWADLEMRAGASDEDRAAWLEERRHGITATEMATLAKAADLDNAITRLVREKIDGTGDNFRGNAYTAWGKEREVEIAVRGSIMWGFRHETRVFHHADEWEWLASPDGIRVTDDGRIILMEIKTGGYPLTYQGAVTKGYYDQCQWQMLVLGSDETLLLWEERIEGEAGWEVGRQGEIPIEASASRQEHLMGIARQFLAALHRAQTEGLPESADFDPLLADLVYDLMEKRREVEVAEGNLREYLDVCAITAAATPLGKLSYTYGNPRRTFDKEAFEAEFPGVYDRFLRVGSAPEKRTLRITPPKEA